jgi:hypothetical protein
MQIPKRGIGRAVLAFLMVVLLVVAVTLIFGLPQPFGAIITWGGGLLAAYFAYRGTI